MSILQEMFPESYMLSNKMPKSSGSESRQVKSTGGDKWLPAIMLDTWEGGIGPLLHRSSQESRSFLVLYLSLLKIEEYQRKGGD